MFAGGGTIVTMNAMSSAFEDKVALGLAEWPLLRVLFFSFWFRIAFVLSCGAALLVAVSLPRLIRVSPAGFQPTVRVSLLDLAQAASLRRSAVRLASQGKYDQAAYAWQQAIANNPADPELFRGTLSLYTQAEHFSPKLLGQAVGYGMWLLRLTHTNASDRALVLRLYEKVELPDFVVQLIDAQHGNRTPSDEASYLKALFLLGRTEAFGERWAKVSDRLPADDQLQLFRAAYDAGWGPPGTIEEGRRRIAAACLDSPHRLLANRLQMLLCNRAVDPSGYETVLHRLEQSHEDRLLDHVGYWQLLLSAGKKEEAQQLARNDLHAPTMPWEVVQLAQTYVMLDMRPYAERFLKRYAQEFASEDNAWSVKIWSLYAELLIENREWDELRLLAAQVRTIEHLQMSLGGFSYFMEGRAAYAQERHREALGAFQEAAKRGFPDPQMGLDAAITLLALGENGLAWDILLPLEGRMQKSVEYWRALFDAAYGKRDGEVLFRAASRAYQLAPRNPSCMNNYAAAMLIQRQQADLASKLTFELLLANPGSLVAKVNHSFALAMNQRLDEAQSLLRTIDATKLSGVSATVYFLNWFEIHCKLRQFQVAWQDLDRIDTNYLFGAQLQWLQQMKGQLPARPRAGG